MREYRLSILTPTGSFFDGQVLGLSLKTGSGDIAFLAGHTDYLGSVLPSVARLTDENGKERIAFCGGGFVNMIGGELSLVVDEFVYAEGLSLEKLSAEVERLVAELASCDAKKEPERATYLGDALARTKIKLSAVQRD